MQQHISAKGTKGIETQNVTIWFVNQVFYDETG